MFNQVPRRRRLLRRCSSGSAGAGAGAGAQGVQEALLQGADGRTLLRRRWEEEGEPLLLLNCHKFKDRDLKTKSHCKDTPPPPPKKTPKKIVIL